MFPNETVVYVYRLPPKMSEGYCFGGGVPITFQNIDWFNGFNGMTQAHLRQEVLGKIYVKEGETYLVCSPENNISFTFQKSNAEVNHD